jgi:transcriptional regulator with XRE-family HTH domain
MSKKILDPTDKHVGARVRMRRNALKMSQQKLGDALGVTFQQVHKYEKGQTRIGAGRLLTIANVLEVPIEFFFKDAPTLAPKGIDRSSMSFVAKFFADADGYNLCAAFVRIANPEIRRSIVQLVKQLAEQT